MEKNKVQIVLIAYAFLPDKTVGALRTSYWFSELPKVMDCETYVITANKNAQGENVIIIPDKGRSGKFNPVKDSGVSWKKDILDFLNTNPSIDPDLVLISGSPFMHFSLSRFLKRKYNCKVLLDYRDPFADNANFNNAGFKIAIKRFFEKRFNALADGLVTVNKYCGNRIAGFTNKPHAYIQNGFDERFKPTLKSIDLKDPKFVYTGKFYFDPSEMLAAINEAEGELLYAGPDDFANQVNRGVIRSKGLVDYQSAVQLVGDADIAVIQTVGDDSISTTKLFDYIRCKRVILIISREKLQGKGISNELEGYPNVFWATNNKEDILRAIDQIKGSTFQAVDQEYIDKFSRRYQMEKLAQFINQLLS